MPEIIRTRKEITDDANTLELLHTIERTMGYGTITFVEAEGSHWPRSGGSGKLTFGTQCNGGSNRSVYDEVHVIVKDAVKDLQSKLSTMLKQRLGLKD